VLLRVGLLIFLPAGTWDYPNAWLFMGLLFVPMFCVGLILFIKSPDMLQKRLHAKEKRQEQKGLIAVSSLLFVAGFVLAGFNFRFGWFLMPKGVVIAASILLLIGYGLR
jgi:protein-S-isoprenylcysteine O-methyltransferase Ste14